MKLNTLFGVNGQSTVEYIMLMSVVLTMTLGFYNSTFFKKLFGDQSVVFEGYKLQMQHSYRHGYPGKLPVKENAGERYQAVHESYFSNGTTHFFYTRDYGR